ncbi:MAG TPA: cytochrome c biogenesis protein CcsA [Candidatus Binatia bacterium]|jgi:ABC-type transport system involved in cytochrome c biogenesis permease subunit|nr:cytochrome c biogenesis protein CcsA [Candidatus Binatia bacterium]
MPLVWLRVAVAFYAVGLLYSLFLLGNRGNWLSRIVEPAVGFGLIFHFVSLVEYTVLIGRLSWASIHYSESLLAFVAMVVFFIFFVGYRTTSPGIVIFPIVFLLTFASAMGQRPVDFTSPALRSSWIFVHVVMIFTGYAGLFLSFGASLLYLMQERALKSKSTDGLLPLPLQTIDDIGYHSLLFGFPFMTFGLIAGSVLAIGKYGPFFFTDPKILLSFIMWVVYMLLLYTRWSSGWRGRRAALLATIAFVVALGVWAANSFSRVHRFPPL